MRYPLILAANPGNWRIFVARKTDPNFQTFSQRVLERDDYVCQFCGFQARQYQEVVNLDNNYRNNKINNMTTACCFCTQCLFLDAVGKDEYGGGTLIYMPELSQPEVNGLCHVLFCAIANATSYRPDAQAIYRDIKTRSNTIETKLGEGMSNPILLSQALIDANVGKRKQLTEKVLRDLRLLPSRNKFSQQIEAWAQAALEEMSED